MNPVRRSAGRKAPLAIVVLLIGIQLVPVDRSNPPASGNVSAPPEVQLILQRACYDCHSNATVWPWYSYVAPVSWLVARDVREGRRELNFSRWDSMMPGQLSNKMDEIRTRVEEGEMPLWFYVAVHPHAALSAADIAALREWTLAASPPAVVP